MDPTRLTVTVTTADGKANRWAFDQPSSTHVPADLSFSNQVPGGDGTLSCTLNRPAGRDWPDLQLLNDIQVHGAGGGLLYSGRIVGFPRPSRDQITVDAVGYSSMLKGAPTFVEVYVDRDVSKWHAPSIARRAIILQEGSPSGAVQVTTDRGVSFSAPENQALAKDEKTEVWWTAPAGVRITRCDYVGYQIGDWAFFMEDAKLWGSDNESDSGVYPETTATTLTLDKGFWVAPVDNRKFLMLRSNAVDGPGTAIGLQRLFALLAPHGAHGLLPYPTLERPPTWPAATGGTFTTGYLGSDIVQDVVSRVAPQLDIGQLDTSTYVIPHCAFHEPVTAEDVILEINKFDGNEWGVFGREFFYRQADPDRLVWEARVSDGAQPSLEGETASGVLSGIVVHYHDVTVDEDRIVGPPGLTSAHSTSELLVDESDSNPWNSHGDPRGGWAKDSLSTPTTLEGAIQYGALRLAERKIPQRRGAITLQGTVRHPSGSMFPVSQVKAGDWIRITDFGNDVPRRIVECSYQHDQRVMRCNVGLEPWLIDTIVARQAAFVSLI